MYSAGACITNAHYPIPTQGSLNARIELESIRSPQLVVERLQLIQDMVRVKASQKVWKRRRNDRGTLGKRRIRAAGEHIILGKNLVVKGAESGSNRCSATGKGVPGDSYTRGEVLQGGIGKPGCADSDTWIGDVAKVGDFAVHFRRHSGELVPEAQIYCQVLADANIVLNKPREHTLPESPVGIDAAGNSEIKLARDSLEEVCQVGESK